MKNLQNPALKNPTNTKEVLILLFGLLFFYPTQTLSQNKVTFEEVEESFQLIFTSPDKALKTLDELERKTKKQSDSLYSIVLNYKGIYYATQNNLTKSIDYFERAYDHVEHDDLFKLKIRVNTGIAYRKNRQIAKSLEVFKEAEIEALRVNEVTQLGMIYGEMASVYSDIQSYEQAVKLVIKSIKLLEDLENPDPILIAIEQQKLGNLYFKMGQSKFALELFDKSASVLKSSKRQDAYALVLTSKADLFLYEKQAQKALQALDEAHPILTSYQNPQWNSYIWELYARAYTLDEKWKLGKTYFRKSLEEASNHQLPRALFTFTQWMDAAYTFEDWSELDLIMRSYENRFDDWVSMGSIEDKKGFFLFMGKWHKHKGQYKESNEALDQMMLYSDSLTSLYNQNAILDLQLKYESESKEQDNMILKQELALERRKMWIVALMSLLLTISIYFVWKFGKIQKQLKTKELEQMQFEKTAIEKELQQAMTLNAIKQQLLKEREQNLLEQTMVNVALQEQLDEVIEKITSENDPATLKKLKSIKQKTIPWNNLLEKFQTVNPEFNQKLLNINPRLTKGDVEFCSMMRMNMSSKDIALVLQISVDSVFTKKYRLMKKLELPKDLDLYTWLNSL